MATTFLYSLAGGMLLVLATGRMGEIAWAFLRIVALIAFALLCGVVAWTVSREGLFPAAGGAWPLRLGIAAGIAAIGTTLLAPFAARWPSPFRGVCALGGVLGLSAACVSLVAPHGITVDIPLGRLVGLVATQVLGGLLIGSITVAWLLGHAYLTATKMTIAPLRHFSRLLLWAIAIRIAFVGASLGAAWWLGGGSDGSVSAHLLNDWLILTLRVAVGLVTVAVFSYMVSQCVRLRSTQSATGILYFGSVFAYVGELASQHLIGEYGWPL